MVQAHMCCNVCCMLGGHLLGLSVGGAGQLQFYYDIIRSALLRCAVTTLCCLGMHA